MAALQKKLVLGGVAATALLGAICALSFRAVHARACRTFSEVERLPHRLAGLVLGCSPRSGGGGVNPFFTNRIKAAAEIFRAGKVDYLLASGDNHRAGYDEPTEMKTALAKVGVPADRIVCDYAGFTTLDSVVRARAVFQQQEITVISQQFHNERAIYLADGNGIDAIGFNAREVPRRWAAKTYLREVLSRVRAVCDVHLLHRRPHHLGPPIPIGPQIVERKSLGAGQ